VAGSPLDVSAARELRDALDNAGYRPTELARLLGGSGTGLAGAPPPYRVARLEARGDPLASLIRLLVLARPVREAALPVSASLLERAGMVERRDGVVTPLAVLLPCGDCLLVSDLLGAGGDEVVPAGIETHRLAALTPRRRIDSALEIGTGGGYLALLAAEHAEHVVATDVSSRALAFAAFNAALNGVTTVELREGSFFDPVSDEQFDLVFSNPPYAVSPESRLVYRDSGLNRDEVSRLVTRGAARALRPRGFAAVAVSWIVEDDVLEKPRRWLSDEGCDAFVFHIGTESALEAAVGWNLEVPEAERTERVAQWIEYYRTEGIESLAYGVLVLRRTESERPWLRMVRLPRGREGPRTGAHVERMFRGVDLADRGPGQPAEGVSLRVRRRWADGAWEDDGALLVCDDGIPFRLPPADGDVAHGRRLVELGLLEPASPG
jgi:methylase of polypeptide subunit release factors